MVSEEKKSEVEWIIDSEVLPGDPQEEPAGEGDQKSAQPEAGEADKEAESTRRGKAQTGDTMAPVERKLTKREILTRLFEKNELILALSRKSTELEAQSKDLNDKWLRSHAEFENYRKRTQKEWELLKQQTRAEVILDILDVVDNFERAFSVVAEKDDDFVQGIRLIYNNILSTLEKFGVRRMEALNAFFDPNYHMAVAQIENKKAESNHVVEVIQEGYLLDDIVIRPAKVIIAK